VVDSIKGKKSEMDEEYPSGVENIWAI
jgi:hypothetical protein